jgi:Zn-dependent peptidase ImmA (M78 family)
MTSNSKLEKDAEQIIQTRGIKAPEDIDLEAIALTLGAKVNERSLTGCEARIIGNNDTAIITINSKSNLERKKFSLGHEIGHWQLHRGINFACLHEDIGNPSGKTKQKEREADRFSANLLMPWFLFRPISQTFAHADFKAISELARRFQTSFIATAIRFVESNVIPAMIVCHDKEKRQWFKRSKDIPERWFPQDTVDHDSFAFDILYGGTGRNTRQQKVSARSWFDRTEAADYEIFEQSTPYINGQVITLLEFIEEGMLEDLHQQKSQNNYRW